MVSVMTKRDREEANEPFGIFFSLVDPKRSDRGLYIVGCLLVQGGAPLLLFLLLRRRCHKIANATCFTPTLRRGTIPSFLTGQIRL